MKNSSLVSQIADKLFLNPISRLSERANLKLLDARIETLNEQLSAEFGVDSTAEMHRELKELIHLRDKVKSKIDSYNR